MIVGVSGKVVGIAGDSVHLQTGPLTLRVLTPDARHLRDSMGSIIHLYTHLRIINEQPVLFGFRTEDSTIIFMTLMGVSGVGPTTALSLMSSLGDAALVKAIHTEDVAALKAAPGVGQGTASKIVVALRGKAL